MTNTPATESHTCDVLIIGGGMAGLTQAIALAGAGLTVTVIEHQPAAALVAAGYDGRTCAIAWGQVRVLEGIGAWPLIVARGAQPILDIRVADGSLQRGVSSLFLHYSHTELEPDGQGDTPFGYIVENRITRLALAERAAQMSGLTLWAPATLAHLERDAKGIEATTTDGRRLRARLAIAADGRASPTRQAAGITVRTQPYGQTAIVCTVEHAQPHNGVAVELFLPPGPFAMLPMTGNRSNIVWTERQDLAPAYLELAEADFLAELRRRFGTWCGDLRLVGPRFAYPLALQTAARCIDTRLALVADAAHVIHPIAGQGLNLGLRDVAALAEVVVDSHRLGLDIGSPLVLERYARWRHSDLATLALATDGINRLFSNDIAPLRLARDLGLATVNRLPPLKRLFMRHAMGVVGDLPRLVAGQPL